MGFTLTFNPGGHVAPTVPLVMFCWIPFVIYLFSKYPAQRAVVMSFLGAWMFLPEATLALPGIPDYTKMSATCYGVLLATFIFDVGRFGSFRFGWIDLPMLVWCLCPFVSSMTNDLGAYDGLSAILDQTMTWGIPYFLGRIYLNNLAGIRQLAVGIFTGGVIYMPLCLLESRLSPQLHRFVYGDYAFGDFGQSVRLGGYRPLVFMRHGLTVGAFMMAATLIGIWLWRTGAVKQLWGFQMKWVVGSLLFTFILMRSTGAYIQFALGLFLLFYGKRFRTALPVFVIITLICSYLYANTATSHYFSDQIIETLSQFLPPERVQSLEFRFTNEELLTQHARLRMVFGWAGWGRSRVPLDEYGNITVQDSLWILAYGVNGLVGLISMTASMLLPVASIFWMRYPAKVWSHPKVAPVAVMAVTVLLYMVDSLVNAHLNPIYVLAIGGVAGLVLKPEKLKQAVRRPAVPGRAMTA
jgi:hypothetical protein